jgi:DNA-binding PadR family transcriptional regulator
MDDSDSHGELFEQLEGYRRAILDGLRYYDGEANTRELRMYADVPTGSIYHHLQKLEDLGLIEVTGTESVETGGKANVYRLTESGEEIATE